MIPFEHLLLGTAVLLLLGILASKASGRLGVPALVIFLIIGMLAGTDGIGKIHFDNSLQAQSLGVVALAYILFAGGLDTDWKSVKPVVGAGLIMATVGVVLTAGMVGWFAIQALGFTPLEGLLLGAIISSTDAAAVFAVMRSKSVGLQGNLKPLIELESGSNDPMAVFLTIGLIRLLTMPEAPVLDLIPSFVLQMGLGAVAGLAFGKAVPWMVNRLALEYEGLYPVFTLATVLLTYSATTVIGGNGFLAVYIAGLLIGNSDFLHKRSLMRFHDGLAWLMQIAMFTALGLLVFPSQLPGVVGAGILVSAFLILVARPVSVFVGLHFIRLSFREKAMVSWVGLRGSVPIILATFPLVAGIPNAGMIFNLVFFIVLTSVLLQGTSIPLVAKLLKVDAPVAPKVEYPIEFNRSGDLKSDMVEVPVLPASALAGKTIVEAGIPRGALIVLVSRKGEFLVPSGGTRLFPGDVLLMLADDESLARVESLAGVPVRA
ncbi:K(+)/H(+) antiporter NhaP2 [compost metagenome]